MELVHHPCHRKTKAGGQEGEEVGEGEEHQLLAEIKVVEAQRSILLWQVAEGEGQQTRGEEGRRMEMVETAFLKLEILQETAAGELLTLVVEGEEQEVGRSPAWHWMVIQLEELVEDGLD